MPKANSFMRSTAKLLLSTAPLAIMLAPAPAAAQTAFSGPNVTVAGTIGGGVVNTGGSAPTFTGATTNTAANQTSVITLNGSRTILNWNSFVLNANDTLQFVFANNSNIALNRVIGGSGTQINGTLTGNGNVWFLDSAGIAVGSNAVINVAGFLASTAGMTDADFFDSNNNFDLSGGSSSIIVNSGAALTASNGAITLMAPQITFAGSANASGSIALVGARSAQITFDSDLDAYLGITINEGSSSNTAIDVTQDASFNAAAVASGGRTLLVAAGNGSALGSILLGGTSANRVEFVEGDVVLYAAGDVPNGSSRTILTGGTLVGLGSATGNGNVTIGAANVSAGSLNAISVNDLTVNDSVSVAGNGRFEAGRSLAINAQVGTGGDYTIRADDWLGTWTFTPLEGGDINIEDTLGGLSIGNVSAADELRITTENGGLNIVGGAITANGGVYLTTIGQGDISLSSNVTEVGANGVVSLQSAGNISQSAGGIVTGTLTGSSVGSTALGSTNSITNLSAFTAGSGFSLLESNGLLVTGPVDGGSGGVGITAGGLLNVSSAVTATGGTIRLNTTGAGSNILLSNVSGIGNGSVDVSLTAAGNISISGPVTGIDVGMTAGGSISTGSISTRDDMALRAGGTVSTGAITTGTTVNGLGAIEHYSGPADTFAADGTLDGHDVRIWGNGVTVGAINANGTGSGAQIDAGTGTIGSGSQDLDITSGAAIVLRGLARGRDVALSAGTSLIANSVVARDDILLEARDGDLFQTGTNTPGSTVDALAPIDVSGAADRVAGSALTGNQVVIRRRR